MTIQQAQRSLYTLLLLISASGCAAEKIELPRRTECIAKAAFLPPQKGAMDREKSKLFFPEAKRESIPLGAFAFDKSGNIYFQFSADCENKSQYATRLIRAASLDAEFEVTDEVVIPGTSTIDVRGASWRD